MVADVCSLQAINTMLDAANAGDLDGPGHTALQRALTGAKASATATAANYNAAPPQTDTARTPSTVTARPACLALRASLLAVMKSVTFNGTLVGTNDKVEWTTSSAADNVACTAAPPATQAR